MGRSIFAISYLCTALGCALNVSAGNYGAATLIGLWALLMAAFVASGEV